MSDAARELQAIHQRRRRVAAPAPTARQEWRCFHCDEVFTDKTLALDHFGSERLLGEAACLIDVKEYRRMEAAFRRCADEDTDLHREMRWLRTDRDAAIRRSEEEGYARGLADAVAAPAPISADATHESILHSGIVAPAPTPRVTPEQRALVEKLRNDYAATSDPASEDHIVAAALTLMLALVELQRYILYVDRLGYLVKVARDDGEWVRYEDVARAITPTLVTREQLASIEWGLSGDGCCPACGWVKLDGSDGDHRADCWLARALGRQL